MIDRYANRNVFVNSLEMYQNTLRERNVKFIKHFSSPNYLNLTQEQLSRLNTIPHTWSYGDRFYKLAYNYYGDVNDWWIIAKFNNRPTESHILLGEIILIPTPVYEIATMLRG